MKSRFILFAFAVGVGGICPAQACSIVVDQNRSFSVKLKEAREAVSTAYAVVDAEVVRPAPAGKTALIFAHRVLSGPAVSWFEVTAGDGADCWREFSMPGERMRLQLHRLKDGSVVAFENGDSGLVDRLLKSNRDRDYPYFAGPRLSAEETNSGSSK